MSASVEKFSVSRLRDFLLGPILTRYELVKINNNTHDMTQFLIYIIILYTINNVQHNITKNTRIICIV